jgi:branched-chain amino acid transport system permease protein
MILSLGLLLLIEGLALVIFGEREKGVPAVTTGVISIWGVSFGAARLIVMVVSLFLLILLFLFLGRVKSGQGMRALSQDAEAAYLQGININRMSMLAFAMGVALAGVAGALLCPISFVSYSVGSYLIMKCFVVVVVGGLGSMPGCLVGGLILGFVESFSLVYLPSDVSYLLIFTMVLIILLVRPQGIMGKAELQ